MSSQKGGRQDQVAGPRSHWIPPACFHDKSSPFRGPRAVHSQQNVAVEKKFILCWCLLVSINVWKYLLGNLCLQILVKYLNGEQRVNCLS